MRTSAIRNSTSAAALALGLLFASAPAFAQQTVPAQPAPPGSPQSTQQDDDSTATPAEQNDPAATAAESAGPLDTGSGDNAIVVTGSRIARPEYSFPNPIQAYTSETIEQSGDTNITDFLVDSPALLGSTTSTDTAGSNLANAQLTGVNLLNLRNLGSNRTLVLIDGRRHVAAYQGTAAVDTNTIPVDLIDRVDVLTGGTSAVYGADGVSGVVNFIMKRDFEGLRIRGQAGISQRGDAGSRYIAATYGKNFNEGAGNVSIAYEFNETDRFSQRQRLNYGKTGPTYAFFRNQADRPDVPNLPDRILYTDLRWVDSSPGGAIDVDLDYYPDFTGEGGVYDRGFVLGGTPLTVGGSSTPRDSYFGDYTPYTKRHIVNALSSYEFSPALRVFADGKFVKTKASTFSQPVYDFYTYLFPDNAYLNAQFPGAVDGASITGRDNFDFGVRRSSSDRKTIRGVFGADGAITDHAKYELSFTYGRTKSTGIDNGTRINDRFYAAIDAVQGPNGVTCRINLPGQSQIQSFTFNTTTFGAYDENFLTQYGYGAYLGAPVTFRPGECVPLNLLGEGAPTQAALDWILYDSIDKAKITQKVLSGSIAGDSGGFFELPGGPVGYAVGAEYRKESSLYVPSALAQQDALLDSSGARVDRGSFSVKEAFAEINVPLLKDLPFAKTLSFGAAGRLSDYSTIGSTKTWSLNGVYAPIKDITFRGTLSQAVRAPNISELFAAQSGTFEFIVDPCGIDRLSEGTSFRAANCAALISGLGFDPTTFDPANDATSPQNSSIQGISGGNRNLSEETARTWTIGTVLRPRFVPGLTLSGDWYHIKIKDAVNTASANEIVDLCVDQPTLSNVYCAAITRSTINGYVDNFVVRPENVASFLTSGLDLGLNYRLKPGNDLGTFNLHVNGNYLKRLEFVPTLGAEVDVDRTEPFAPKYSATGDLTWTKGPLTVNYGVNYFSKTRRFTQEVVEANPDIVEAKYLYYKPRWEHEAQVAFDVDKRFNIYAGVNNLFDTKPDVGAVGYPISAVGRSMYLGVKAKLF